MTMYIPSIYENIAKLSFKDLKKYIKYIYSILGEKKLEKYIKFNSLPVDKIWKLFPELRDITDDDFSFIYAMNLIVEIYFKIKRNPKLTVEELAIKIEKKDKENETNYSKRIKEIVDSDKYNIINKRVKKLIEKENKKARKEDKEWQEKIKKGEEKFYLK